MVKFPPQLLEQIKDAMPVSRVVGARVPLRKQGHTLVACCPFHKEKSPSFHVNDARHSYHCFGCGAHGDVIRFLTEYEGMSFPEAVERLANEAGIPLPKPREEDRAQAAKMQSQYEVLELATQWFEQQLQGTVGSAAREYLAGRGLSEQTIRTFRLGFAPDARDGVKKHLAAQGVTDAAMLAAGLIGQPEDGRAAYDRFRGRVMFPIENSKGKVIAFGGRILGAGEPKYLNSPETDLFSKSHTLYNLHRARKPAFDAEAIIAVEGYMDVIALAQAGIANAVAPLGTAVTEHQLRMLWQMASEPVICLDGDAAGFKAMARVTELALPMLKPGLSFRFALLPEGDDPDTLVRRLGAGETRALLARAQGLAEMIWYCHTHNKHYDTPEQKAALEETLMQQVALIADRTVQNYYRDFFKSKLWQARRAPGGKGGKSATGGKPSAPLSRRSPQLEALARAGHSDADTGADPVKERLLLATAIAHPALLERADVEEMLVSLPLATAELEPLRRALLDVACEGDAPEHERLVKILKAKGLGAAVQALHSAPEARHIRADTSLEEALAGWSRIVDAYQAEWDSRAKEQKIQELDDVLTEESLSRLRALKANS
ncbi:MAG: DNA primase [Alphaproteobacteria bacterium]|nr:DNA primase [Alphaproteobacteria bacterium]